MKSIPIVSRVQLLCLGLLVILLCGAEANAYERVDFSYASAGVAFPLHEFAKERGYECEQNKHKCSATNVSANVGALRWVFDTNQSQYFEVAYMPQQKSGLQDNVKLEKAEKYTPVQTALYSSARISFGRHLKWVGVQFGVIQRYMEMEGHDFRIKREWYTPVAGLSLGPEWLTIGAEHALDTTVPSTEVLVQLTLPLEKTVNGFFNFFFK